MEQDKPTGHSVPWKAVIFDLDGVVTDTAAMHAAAWKQMFDGYLQQRGEREGKAYRPFDIVTDYRRYVDGKPRQDGVADFLASRDIALEYGSPDDDPAQETVCGLGTRKNQLFLARLEKEGVRTYADVVQVIRDLRAANVKTAIISASRNCTYVLERAGIADLFDVRVDGVMRENQGFDGKPAPDIFLKAASLLDVAPADAVVVEDALAGVEAGRAGDFGCVIAIDRRGEARQLKEHGADVGACDARDIAEALQLQRRTTDDLPSALSNWNEVEAALAQKQPILFLDFDGTLTPIVERPGEAYLSNEMEAILARLARMCTVAIISGRDLADVRERVGIEQLYYAGSHGLELCGPQDQDISSGVGREVLPTLDAAEARLKRMLEGVQGAEVERKRFSLAAHYRRVADPEQDAVEEAVDETLRQHDGLRKRHGKKVFEIQPDVDWDKGKAVQRLLQILDASQKADILPFYIGDDVTDKDAFRTLSSEGIGIIVHAGGPKPTRAQYVLADPSQVRTFLERMAAMLTPGGGQGRPA